MYSHIYTKYIQPYSEPIIQSINTLQNRGDLCGPKEPWFIDGVELEMDLKNDKHLIMGSREEGEGHYSQ